MSQYGSKSLVARVDRSDKNDYFVVYNDSNHMCVMKLCPYVIKNPIKNDCIDKEYADFNRYHIRYYIPKQVYTSRNKRIEKLIVMFNGLNEIDHFTLYDQIGEALCKKGYGAALIPIPDHLNRHPKYRYRKPTSLQKKETPLDYIKQDPHSLYERFLQYAIEINQLCDTITACHRVKDHNMKFYQNMFSPNIKISCLGYSMGGLVALCMFLKNPSRFNACFLLNSGIHLVDIHLPKKMIEEKEWDNLVVQASEAYGKEMRNNKENPYSELFGLFFIGNMPASAREMIRKVNRKVLFIFGGSDAVMPMKSFDNLSPQGKGLSIFQIPGLSHFPAIDREWNNWSQFAVNLIVDFDENASIEHWSKQELLETTINLNSKYSMINSPKEYYHLKIRNDEDERLFNRIIDVCKCYYPNIEVFLSEVLLEQAKNEKIDRDKTKFCAANGLDYKKTIKVLTKQRDLLVNEGVYRKSGVIAKSYGYIKIQKDAWGNRGVRSQ